MRGSHTWGNSASWPEAGDTLAFDEMHVFMGGGGWKLVKEGLGRCAGLQRSALSGCLGRGSTDGDRRRVRSKACDGTRCAVG